MKNKFVFIAAFSGFFCIAFGAFVAHGVEKILTPKALAWIDTGLKYQMFHTLALLALGLFQIANNPSNPPACRAKAFSLIGGAWAIGILLFSGSLYALALDLFRIPMITPIGGLFLMFGWLVLLYIRVRNRKNVQ